MTWLVGRTAVVVGDSPSILQALRERGANLVGSDALATCDILIHVAPPRPVRPAHELRHAEWRETLAEGLDRRFELARAFAIACRAARRPGAVLFVGAPEQALGSDHAAAAGALGNLTKTLGVEWARDGLRVNTVLTGRHDAALGNLAAYLVSDYAAYVTGAVMGVDCGDC